MFTDKRLRILAPLVIASLAFAAGRAWAQTAAPPEASAPAPAADTEPAPGETTKPAEEITVADKDLAGLWADFFHYITVAQPDAARSYGQAILNKQPKPEDVYLLSVKMANTQKRLNDAADKTPALKPIVQKIQALIEQGYQGEKSNPEIIARTIDQLGGGLRQYENAVDRLVRSGEFALPQLIQKLSSDKTPNEIKQRILNVLVRMGKEGVNGLCAALGSNDAEIQEQLAGVLAKIGYKQAAPYLKELAMRKGLLDRTRAAAIAALTQLAGPEAAAKSVSQLAFDYAQRFYNHEQSLMPDPRLSQANVWFWQEGLGLVFKPVPKEIFPDLYAMRLCRMALENESKFDAAMGLWLAADIRREASLPAGSVDPTAPKDMPAAKFFALASPPEILQDVLARGLKDKDSAVAAGAIEALVRTQGAKSLVQPVAGGAQPLVEAMTFSNRIIRFQAAIALANATPSRPFNGSDLVLTVLNEALRLNSKKVALLAAADEKVRNEMKDALRAAGYEVVDVAEAGKALAAAKQAGTIDLAVLDAEAVGEVLPAMRKDPAMISVPGVVLTDEPKVREKYRTESLLEFMPAGGKLPDVLGKLLGKGTAGEALPAEQSAAWILRVCEAARLLALTNNTVYDLVRLRPALIENLGSANAEVQVAAAKALAAISAPEAQQAIAGMAIKQDVEEKLRIDMLNVLTESIRRFGNQINEPQVQSLYALVSGTSSQTVREAAAQAWGSLNLPSEKSKALILQFAPKS